MIKLNEPIDNDPHTHADFVELLCLCTEDRVCSEDYLRDYISDMTEKRLSDNALVDCFGSLSWREDSFGEWYPFELNGAKTRISSIDQLSYKQKVYVFLLCCSSLPYFESDHRRQLTDTFEILSVTALSAVWPARGVVKPFGKNTTDYAGPKWERMNSVGRDIGASPKYSPSSFRPQDSGDGGIDIVAWLDLDEHESRNIPSAFGQCACSRANWPKKQLEASNSTHATNMAPSYPWLELMFIPHSFRSGTGKWAYDGSIAQVILFDRPRLINCLRRSESGDQVTLPNVLEELLNFRMDLV